MKKRWHYAHPYLVIMIIIVANTAVNSELPHKTHEGDVDSLNGCGATQRKLLTFSSSKMDIAQGDLRV